MKYYYKSVYYEIIQNGSDGTLTFTFRAFSRRFYPERLTISTFVRRKRNNNLSLSVQLGMFIEPSAKH